MVVEIGTVRIGPKKDCRYQGSCWMIRVRSEGMKRAEKQMEALSRIIPNMGGPYSDKNRVIAGVDHLTVLYGAPVWHTVPSNRALHVFAALSAKNDPA